MSIGIILRFCSNTPGMQNADMTVPTSCVCSHYRLRSLQYLSSGPNFNNAAQLFDNANDSHDARNTVTTKKHTMT